MMEIFARGFTIFLLFPIIGFGSYSLAKMITNFEEFDSLIKENKKSTSVLTAVFLILSVAFFIYISRR